MDLRLSYHPDLARDNGELPGWRHPADWDRTWHGYYSASENVTGQVWELRVDEFVAESSVELLEAVGDGIRKTFNDAAQWWLVGGCTLQFDDYW
jgi:hypothetical protein